MPKSLIRKNQLNPDVADLILEYGSGFFLPFGATGVAYTDATGENVVYTTGDQTINGVKNFTSLRSNGNEVALASEVVYNQNNQTIYGTKTFSNTIVGSINGNAATVTDGVYTTGDQTIGGTKNFNFRPTVTGANVLIDGEAIPYTNLTSLVDTSSNQTIGGVKNFSTRPTVTGANVLIDGEAIPYTNLTSLVDTSSNQTIGGVKNFSTRPTVTGASVLINGDTMPLPEGVIYATGDQTIGGNKTFEAVNIIFSGVNVSFVEDIVDFDTHPKVNGSGVVASNGVQNIEVLTAAQYSGITPSNNVLYIII